MRIGPVAVLIGLAACSSAPPPVAITPSNPVPVAVADTCGAAPFGYLIAQDATALEKVLILREVRVTRPGTAITQDVRPVRINFNIGADERIRTITCG